MPRRNSGNIQGFGCMASERNTTLYCSFCGKAAYEVMKLITTERNQLVTNICDECILTGTAILVAEGVFETPAKRPSTVPDSQEPP